MQVSDCAKFNFPFYFKPCRSRTTELSLYLYRSLHIPVVSLHLTGNADDKERPVLIQCPHIAVPCEKACRYEKIKILIIDDHKLIRDTWCFILQRETDFKVIGSCRTAEDGLALAKVMRPDVILLDVNLPGMNGVEVAAQFRRNCSSSKVLGLSIHTDPSYAKQMMTVAQWVM
jgi:CheY-like chemotaxis protein